MARPTLAAVLLALWATGCQLPRSGPWPAVAGLKSQGTPEPGPRAALIRTANNPAASRDERAAAVFSLFRGYAKPGSGTEAVRDALEPAEWVREARLDPIVVVGGYVPLRWGIGDRAYCLPLFVDEQGKTDWWIYFALAGPEAYSAADGLAFLLGTGDKTHRLKGFTLCRPDNQYEWFTEEKQVGTRDPSTPPR